MAEVNTYDVNVGYRDNLGRTPLPAAIQPLDFSALDRALQTENEIASKALDTITGNLETLGRMQDDLTNIPLANPYHEQQLSAAKKEAGITEDAFRSALTDVDNPTALYELDRKMKKLSTNPRVKNIMYENAIVDNFKANLPTISDPNLRAKAVSDLTDALQDVNGTAIKNLNLSMYETIDLPGAYKAVIDQYAPATTTAERKMDDAGNTYTENVTKRDPKAVEKARKYFMQNPKVKNNLIAQGIIDNSGEFTVDDESKSWFDIIEAGETQAQTQITDVKGIQQSKDNSIVLTEPTDLKPLSYTPNVVDGYDLGIISGEETSGRKVTVHPDSAKAPQINFGAYSFNKDVARNFIESLRDATGKNKDLNNTINSLLEKNLLSIDKTNVKEVTELYQKIEKILGTDTLAKAESAFAIQEFGAPVIEHAAEKDVPVTEGGKTFLMDAAIHHGQSLVNKWINSYAENADGSPSLEEYILKKRLALIAKTGSIKDADRPRLKDRVWRVYKASVGKNATEPATDDTNTAASDSTSTGATDMSIYEGIY
jgi:hypothetical protein